MSERNRATSHGGFPRILIVDDDQALAEGLMRAIETQGYVVRTINQGARALETAATFKPDLILLDVMMPAVDGWEVLARLRANESTRRTPVIMLTAADTDASKVKGLTLGADDYVTKPFSVRELRCRITAVLRRTGPVPAYAAAEASVQVVMGGSTVEFLKASDVYFVEGVRNYSYVHTADARFLSRLTLGDLERQGIDGFWRVHRSFIVNMDRVKGCGWASKSAYRLKLADIAETEIPVSRALVVEVQRHLGLKP